MAVPYTFATATSSIPLSQLDANFATGITLGNTTVYLGNTTTSIGNLTLTNATISSVASTFPNSYLANSSVTIGSTNVSLGGTATTITGLTLTSPTITGGTSTATQNLANVTGTLAVGNGGTGLTSLTAGYIPYGNGTSAFSSSANITFNGTTLTLANDASISGLTVGKGGGSDIYSTALGTNALLNNTSGISNTAVGRGSLGNNTTGLGNAALARDSLVTNTTGSYNSAFGYQSLQANTTQSYSTGIGWAAGFSNTTGQITAVGAGALYYNTTGLYNTAVGYQAGYSNTTGAYQSFFGLGAGAANTTGAGNTFIGASAGASNTTGSRNTFVGGYSIGTTASGLLMTTGSANTILGAFSGNQGGLDIRTASNYIVLSDGDGNPRQVIDSSGSVIIANAGSSATSNNSGIVNFAGGATNYSHISGTASGTLYIGFNYNAGTIGSITQNGTTGVLYNLTSDYRLKNNPTALTGASEFIMALQPKTWDWWDGSGKGVGFIAHEFMEVAKYSGNGTKDEVDAEGKPKYQSIQPSSSEVMANLVALVQELNAKITALETQLGAK